MNLKFAEGDLRAEYISGSEVQNTDGSWAYQFLINDLDLPGGLTMDDVRNINLIDPYWECPTEEPVPEEECPARAIVCFDAIESINELAEGDEVLIGRFDPECDLWCLRRIDPAVLGIGESAITEKDSLDYEVLPIGEDITGPVDVYVTHMPRDFYPADGIRLSVDQFGSGTMTIEVWVNGTQFLTTPASLRLRKPIT